MAITESPGIVGLRLYTRRGERSYFVSAAAIGDVHVARGAKVRIDLAEGDTGAVGGQAGAEAPAVMTRTIRRLLPGGKDEVAFPLSRFPRGSWCFRAQVIDRFGRHCPTRVLQIQQRPQPPWFGSDEAVTRGVPAPWTPLKRKANTVACWGRRYDLNGDSVLSQVRALDTTLLAGPVQIVIDGKAASFSAPRWLEQAEDQVIAIRRGRVLHLAIDMQVQIEFDGMMRLDWSIGAEKPTTIKSLVMAIPLRPELAKLFYQWRGKYQCGDDRRIGMRPRGRMWKNFRPFVWLGDERCGLSWFAESSAQWFCRDPDKAIEVTREGDAVMLRLHIISQPVRLRPGAPPTTDKRPVEVALPLRYTFGLQATPVKPAMPDAWDYRCFCLQAKTPGADNKLKLSPSLLDRLDRAGVRTVIVFEHWTDIEAHYLTRHQRELKRIIEACHARGMQVLLYFGFLLSNLAPEYDGLAEQSLAMPLTGWSAYNYPPQPVQTAWRVCLNSAWQDFLPYGIARVVENLNVDGVYLDGTSHSFACRNLSHGCGALRHDGSVLPTYPIFAVRSAMKRIYRAVRSRKPDGQVNVHNSADMVIPTLAFATSTWDGEQFSGLKAGVNTDSFLPLDTFRTEFMGHPWGVPAELLCYAGQPLTYRQAWALAILHDVPVRPMLTPDGGDLDLCAAIWRVMDGFDRKGSRWRGYWDREPIARVSGRGVFASGYAHPRRGKLIAVSNLGARRQTATLHIQGPHASDALTGQTLAVRRARTVIELDPLDFMLIHVAGGNDKPRASSMNNPQPEGAS